MRIFNILCIILLGIPAFLLGVFWFFIYGGFSTGFEVMKNWNADRVMNDIKEQENG